MKDRNSAPNSAFAFVGELNGETHRLLMHHDADSVQDGNEHDTVNPQLLKAALNLVDQVPFKSEEDREAARIHLQGHARSIVVDEQPDNLTDSPTRRTQLTDEDAKKIVSQQAGGPSGNDSVTNPNVEATLDDTNRNQTRLAEEALRQESGSGSITKMPKKDKISGEKSTENPAGVKGDIKHVQDEGSPSDVENKGKPTGNSSDVMEGKEDNGASPGQHVDNGEELVNNPNADQQAEAGKKVKGQNAPKSSPTEDGKEPNKKAKPEKEDDEQVAPEGKKVESQGKNPLSGKPGKGKKKGNAQKKK